MRHARLWILALLLSLPLAAATAEPAQASTSVSLSFFYDSLSHHGDWFVSADYGYVWRPFGISASWRPYSDGRWVYTDVGWTFVSSTSWGWGPYHYGRWYYDPYYGWVWVPGTEWAPAWVTFYEGPGWIGWAPLPPRVSYVSWRPIRYDPRAFCFVESRYFTDPYVHRRIAPVSYNTRLVRTARDISRFTRRHDAVVNLGPSIERIERATRTRVRQFRLAERTSLARGRSELRGDTVDVFRPRVSQRATHPPRVKEDRTRRERDARAVTPERGRSSSRVESPPVDRSRGKEKATPARPVERRPAAKPVERAKPLERKEKPPARSSSARPSDTRGRSAVVERRSSSTVRTTSVVRERDSSRAPSRAVERSTAPRERQELRAPQRTERSGSAADNRGSRRVLDPRAAALERARAEQAAKARDAKGSGKEKAPARKTQSSRRPPRG